MLNYTLEADSARQEPKRAFFSINGTQLASITLNMNINNGKKCQGFILYVKVTSRIVQNSVGVILLGIRFSKVRETCPSRGVIFLALDRFTKPRVNVF